ncbi:MAG: hydantoinase/oxoprolinase family protein, partial [Rhodococcus sp.]|nr:hydantoinase/oxoprolinase family protein [Rhodococcus sp. (in: high G+C Gram-positive bacteria)]
QEGYDIADCSLEWASLVEDADGAVTRTEFDSGLDVSSAAGNKTLLALKAIRELPHSVVKGGSPETKSVAASTMTRSVRTSATSVEDLPVYQLDQQVAGAMASGPAIVEGQFFTAQVPAGWDLEISNSGDLILTDTV